MQERNRYIGLTPLLPMVHVLFLYVIDTRDVVAIDEERFEKAIFFGFSGLEFDGIDRTHFKMSDSS